MEGGIITQLTYELIRTVCQDPGRKLKGVVQCLSISEHKNGSNTLHTVVLSDGTYTGKFLLYPSIIDNFLTLVKPFDVIEAGLLRRDANTQLMLLYHFQVIYTGLTEAIGNAIEYSAGIENPKGDGNIPLHIVDRYIEQQTLSKGKAGAGQGNPGEPNFIEIESNGVKEKIRKEPIMKISEERARGNEIYIDIANLNMYDRSWTIRGRVVKKGDLKKFKSGNKDGSVFNIVIRDETSSIQASFFNETCEKFFDFIQQGKMYAFSDGMIKNAGKFNMTEHKYEITFGDKCAIREIANDSRIGNEHIKITSIEEASKKKEHDSVDVLGIIDEILPIRDIPLKDGSATQKRSIFLIDQSNYRIEISLWGELAVNFDHPLNSIVMITNLRVKEFQGKQLGSSFSTKIINNVTDCPELKALLLFKGSRKAGEETYINLTENTPTNNMIIHKVGQITKESNMMLEGNEGGKVYFTVVGYLMRALNSLFYDSCPNENCMKKVVENSGAFFCEKCHKSFLQSKPRFMTAFRFSDDTGVMTISLAGEEYCQAIFDCATEKLRELRNTSENELNNFTKQHMFGEFQIRVMAKKEFFNNESRIKFQAVKLKPINRFPENTCEAYLRLLE